MHPTPIHSHPHIHSTRTSHSPSAPPSVPPSSAPPSLGTICYFTLLCTPGAPTVCMPPPVLSPMRHARRPTPSCSYYFIPPTAPTNYMLPNCYRLTFESYTIQPTTTTTAAKLRQPNYDSQTTTAAKLLTADCYFTTYLPKKLYYVNLLTTNY